MCLKTQAKRTVYLHVFSKCFWRCLVVPGRCLFSGKHLSLLVGVDAIIITHDSKPLYLSPSLRNVGLRDVESGVDANCRSAARGTHVIVTKICIFFSNLVAGVQDWNQNR